MELGIFDLNITPNYSCLEDWLAWLVAYEVGGWEVETNWTMLQARPPSKVGHGRRAAGAPVETGGLHRKEL